MKTSRAIHCLAALLATSSAAADPGTVEGTVHVTRPDASVSPLSVVVYVVGFAEPPPDAEARITQHDRHFEPDLLAITVGQTVSFPNDDVLTHNVFSLSAAREFDLGQYPRGRTKTKKFPAAGVVDVYCNIHPEMAATVLVLPNRRFARPDDTGAFRITGVPPGKWTLYAYTRGATTPVSTPIEVAPGQVTQAELTLVEDRKDHSHLNKFGEKYRESRTYP